MVTGRMFGIDPVDARFHNPFTDTRTTGETRCVIGRHKVESYKLMFELDGKLMCMGHAQALINLWEANSRGPLSEHEKQRLKVREDEMVFAAQRKTQMQQISGEQPGFVYYLRIDRHIKIGYAADVQSRMRAYPPAAELLAVHPGTRNLETQMHHDFRSYLDKGREWFTPGPQLMAHIDRVRAQFGDPAILAHRYRTPKRAS